jgi:hypothetical protein
MKGGLPKALIYGIENFVAQKLAEELIGKSIDVVGVGLEIPEDLNGKEGFEFEADFENIEGEISYVFDFVGNEKLWRLAEAGGGRLTIVTVNKREIAELILKRLKEKPEFNWRLVDTEGVFGRGMEEEGFLAEAFRQAASNHNLILPMLGMKYRVLAVEDAVEAILRASFLTGTERGEFLVVGNETDSEEVAKVLIEEAKMTRFKVMQKEIPVEVWNEGEVNKNWEKLRWQPRLSFREGTVETLRYFLTKIDEESRKGSRKEVEAKKRELELEAEENVVEEKAENRKLFDVVVEEKREEVDEKREERERVVEKKNVESGRKKVKRIKKKKPVAVRMTVETERREDEVVVGKRLMGRVEGVEVKNSNLRPVVEKEEKGQEEMVVKANQLEPEEVKVEEKKVIVIKRQSWWKWRYLAVMAAAGVMAGMVVPINWVSAAWSGYKNLDKTMELVREKKYEEAKKLAEAVLMKTRRVDDMISEWGGNRWAIGRNLQSILRVEEEAAVLAKKGSVVAAGLEEVDGAIFGDREIEIKSKLEVVAEGLKEVNSQIGVLQARLNGDWGWLPSRFRSWPQKSNRQLEDIKKVLGSSVEGVGVLPEMLGVDGKRREYMVLLQNEMELRPGGGFLGSYGILSFEDGKLLNFEIKDIYEADGQLKGHVEPPTEIKTYLGEGGWFMRDANWNANFVRASKDITWFLEKETGRKVDGVIGIDLAVAEKILEVTGEVFVPDFRETINQDNLFEQAEFYAETKFFPGSNQKASFLGGLGKQLFEEIKTMNTEKKVKLYQEIIGLLESNDIQVSLNEKAAARKMAELGWDGAIYQGKCGMDRCLADYLYVVEANLGVNKANYFLYRSMEQQVDISQNAVTRVVKINYENRAKNTNWPGGDYKNYLRVYLPNDINLAEVSITDTADPNKKEAVSGEKLVIKEVEGKRELGFLVLVPVGTKRTVEIRYSTGISLMGKDKFSYLHYIQRQPGFGDTGLVSLISYPSGWTPMQVEPAASLVGGKLLFNTKLDKDIKMGVELGK